MDPKKLERKVIEKFGGKPTPASGARPGQKADGHVDFRLRIEHKSTSKGAYRLHPKVLLRLERDSKSSKGEPVLIITFPRSKSLVIFPEHCADDVEVSRTESLPIDIDPYDYGIRIIHPDLAYTYITASMERAKQLLNL